MNGTYRLLGNMFTQHAQCDAKGCFKLLGFTETAERTFRADGPLSSLTSVFSSLFSLHVLLLIALFTMGFGQNIGCGGFLEVSRSEQTIVTSEFKKVTRCVWILETEVGYIISMTVSFQSQKYPAGNCQSFQIRDGHDKRPILKRANCSKRPFVRLKSRYRWLYVLFESEGSSPAGVFQATFFAEPSDSKRKFYADPTVCRAYQYQCPNKLCLSYSYLCDRFNDCGFIGPGSDEEGCYFHAEPHLTLMIGIALGFLMMTVSVLAGLFLEKRQKWDRLSLRIGEERCVRPLESNSSNRKISKQPGSWKNHSVA